MNKRGRRSLSTRVEQIFRVYAPSMVRGRQRTLKRSSRCSVHKVTPHRRRSVVNRLKPKAVYEILCYQELAYEIISRELHESLRVEHGLKEVSYTGDSFILKGNKKSKVMDAVHQLSNLMWEYTPKIPEVPANKGTAEDLNNVTFCDDIKFLGELECVICGGIIKPGEKVRRTTCLHIFHMKCIEPWLSNKQVCPIDKMPI